MLGQLMVPLTMEMATSAITGASRMLVMAMPMIVATMTVMMVMMRTMVTVVTMAMTMIKKRKKKEKEMMQNHKMIVLNMRIMKKMAMIMMLIVAIVLMIMATTKMTANIVFHVHILHLSMAAKHQNRRSLRYAQLTHIQAGSYKFNMMTFSGSESQWCCWKKSKLDAAWSIVAITALRQSV